jgi:hypothetical protein
METVIPLLRLVCAVAIAGQALALVSPTDEKGMRVRLCGRGPTPLVVTIPFNDRKSPVDDDSACHAPCLQAMRRDAKNCCGGLDAAA